MLAHVFPFIPRSHFVSPGTLATIRGVFFVWHVSMLIKQLCNVGRLPLPQLCYLTIQTYSLINIFCLVRVRGLL